jgi:hypothetical protein
VIDRFLELLNLPLEVALRTPDGLFNRLARVIQVLLRLLELVASPVGILAAIRWSCGRLFNVRPCNVERRLGVLNGCTMATREIQSNRCHSSDSGGNDRLASRDAYRRYRRDQTRSRRSRKEPEWVRVVDRISTRIPVLIDPAREPDWVALRGLARPIPTLSDQSACP